MGIPHWSTPFSEHHFSFEGVCFELPSSWPPARVDGRLRAAARGQDPGDPGDSRDPGMSPFFTFYMVFTIHF